MNIGFHKCMAAPNFNHLTFDQRNELGVGKNRVCNRSLWYQFLEFFLSPEDKLSAKLDDHVDSFQVPIIDIRDIKLDSTAHTKIVEKDHTCIRASAGL